MKDRYWMMTMLDDNRARCKKWSDGKGKNPRTETWTAQLNALEVD
jgi:hypothetical protein